MFPFNFLGSMTMLEGEKELFRSLVLKLRCALLSLRRPAKEQIARLYPGICDTE